MPMGKYRNFADCMKRAKARNKKAYCGKIYHATHKKRKR